MNPRNAEIDSMLTERLPLIYQAARSVCAWREDELVWEIVPLWYSRYLKNPAKWWDVLTNDNPGDFVADMKQLGKRVLQHWQARERDESLTDDLLCTPVEWGDCNLKLCYENGIGERVDGTYVADDEDLWRLFQAVARHNMTDEDGAGLGRVEAADLMGAFRSARPAVAHAIRLMASGYGAKGMTNRRAYQQVANVLMSAL